MYKLLSISLVLFFNGLGEVKATNLIPMPTYTLKKPKVLIHKEYNLFKDDFSLRIKPFNSMFKPYNPFKVKRKINPKLYNPFW